MWHAFIYTFYLHIAFKKWNLKHFLCSVSSSNYIFEVVECDTFIFIPKKFLLSLSTISTWTYMWRKILHLLNSFKQIFTQSQCDKKLCGFLKFRSSRYSQQFYQWSNLFCISSVMGRETTKNYLSFVIYCLSRVKTPKQDSIIMLWN